MRKLILTSLLLLVAALVLGASEQKAAIAEDAVVHATSPADLQWAPSGAPFAEGAWGAVLEGDPSKAGHFTLRFRMPKGYTVDPHWHTTAEYVTVLAGTMEILPGTVIDEDADEWMGVGTYFAIPGKSPHYAIAGEDDTLIQITGEGPFDLHYVNPDGSEKK